MHHPIEFWSLFPPSRREPYKSADQPAQGIRDDRWQSRDGHSVSAHSFDSEIAFFENAHVVVHVAGGDECHSAYCETIVAGDTGPRPGFCGHILEKRNRREAHATEFLHMR